MKSCLASDKYWSARIGAGRSTGRVTSRGSSYFSSQWLAQVSEESLPADLQLAARDDLNMVRLFAHVEPPAFYALADELGLLVWQDFRSTGATPTRLPLSTRRSANYVQ